MTNKEAWTKFWNARLNSSISVKVWFRSNILKNIPTIENGYESINNKGYKLVSDELIKDFTNITVPGNWGSARPDMDNVFVPEMVNISDNKITITTKAEVTVGHDWNGKESTKPTISGLVSTDAIYDMDGMYSVIINQDDYALGSWDAWWFFDPNATPEVDPSYQEIDMIERFYDRPSYSDRITTTVHHKTQNQPQAMYNSALKIKGNEPYMLSIEFPKNENKFKIYYNGMLIFIGLQWKPTRKMTMKVNSGLLARTYNQFDIKERLDIKDYFFEVSNIKHWNKN